MILNIPDWNFTALEDIGITVEGVQNLGSMLNNYLSNYHECYSHIDQSNIERKSIEPIAL
jgi:hypothetical protein